MRRHHRAPAVLLVLALGLLAAVAASAQVPPLGTTAPPTGTPGSVTQLDRNGDGVIDYKVTYDRGGLVAEEDMDFNYDGKMDTFYYYAQGVLQRVEIDSNNDGKIDIWVQVKDGTYVTGYQRDTDGDGKPDFVRDFSKG